MVRLRAEEREHVFWMSPFNNHKTPQEGILEVGIWSSHRTSVWMAPLNNHKTPQEIPVDRNHQRLPTSRATTCYDTTTRSPFCLPAKTAPTVQGGRGVISADTLRHRLPSTGLRVLRPYVGPILSDRHRNKRRCIARRYRHWRSQR